MSTDRRTLGWVASMAVAVLTSASVWLSVVGDNLALNDIGWLGGQAAFGGVGAIILLRQPGNTVGRILSASGVLALFQATCWRYADVAFAATPPLPFAVPAAWLASWVYVPMFALFIILLPLYFPNGRLLSHRWRPVVWITVAVAVLESLYRATAPGSLEQDFGLANPMTLSLSVKLSQALEAVGGDDTLFAAFAALGPVAVASVALRYRRARGIERLQLKWFVAAIALLVTYLMVSAVVLEVVLNRAGNTVTDLIGLACLLCVPASIGVAVLRYRLFEIDRIVSRTVSWALVTVVLVGVYLACVTVLSATTASVAGDSPLAVAAATLAAAAAFGPVRRRIQSAVDRRFNRARYNASSTVERYRARLRDALEIEGISADLEQAVTATLQPSAVSLWLRPPEVRA